MQVPCSHCEKYLGTFCVWVGLLVAAGKAWPPALGGAMQKAELRQLEGISICLELPGLLLPYFSKGLSASENSLPNILVFKGDHEFPALQ